MTWRSKMIGPSLVLALVACSTKSAGGYKTGDMVATLNASAGGDGATLVKATLTDPSNPLTFIQLVPGDDSFVATSGTETQTLAEASLLGAVSYSARFNKDAAGSEFHVRLTRTLDAGAVDSVVMLPQPFTLAVLSKASYSRAHDAMVISWATGANADAMSLDIAGSCLDLFHTGLDAGATSFTVPVAALQKHAPASSTDKVPDECDATVTVTRSHEGTVDKAFRSGHFSATQSRSATFKSVL